MKRNIGKTSKYTFIFDSLVYHRAKRIALKLLGKENQVPTIIRDIMNKGLESLEKKLNLPDISVDELPEENRDILLCQLNTLKYMKK
jgi:hypothetical protein